MHSSSLVKSSRLVATKMKEAIQAQIVQQTFKFHRVENLIDRIFREIPEEVILASTTPQANIESLVVVLKTLRSKI